MENNLRFIETETRFMEHSGQSLKNIVVCPFCEKESFDIMGTDRDVLQNYSKIESAMMGNVIGKKQEA